MDKIPFNVYDFFAYLSSGAILIVTGDYIFHLGLLHNSSIPALLGIALIILAYILGQIVAHFSLPLFEKLIVHRILRPPSVILLGGKPRLWIFKWIFVQYHEVLKIETRRAIITNAEATGFDFSRYKTDESLWTTEAGEDLFQHVYPIVTAVEKNQARLDIFLNLYGFARNISLAFLISSAALYAAYCSCDYSIDIRWAYFAVIVGILMFYRFLRFYLQYSFELFIRFSAPPSPPSAPKC